ncbi:phage minor capsid protein [Priestia megaterium]|uniref:phage minor capsid protein n=1 Tax=Priestia megaterium TaxID=1404 RepID=UPI002E23C785|nr:phage minor capsid protein [Priestia megaterium]MED4234415.1 hypothetical protein [Priestia megaterium]
MNSNQLIEYFADVIQQILNKIGSASNLSEDKNAQALISAILKALDGLGIKASEVMPKELEKAYYLAVDEASASLEKAGAKTDGAYAMTKRGFIAKGFQRKIHIAAVKKIVSDTLTDLKAAIRTAKKSTRTTINKVLKKVKKEIADGLILGNHNRVVRKRLAKAFQEEGLTAFLTAPDKKGKRRRLRVDKYAGTVVRTKMREANTQGAANRYIESGVTLVKVSQHAPTCHVCAGFQGMVISLTGDNPGFKSINDGGVQLPPFHPNCRHTIIPFVIAYKTKEEIQKEKDKWKTWKPKEDIRSTSQQRAYKKEQDIRRKAHEELKMYERYKAVLGSDAPKTIGAFRRMKRANSPSWQKVKAKYRNASREMRAAK